MHKINQLSFRELDKKYVYVSFKPQLPLLAQHFADADQANGILSLAYVDHQEGLQFEVLCNACFDEAQKTIKFFETNDAASIKLPYGLLQECEALVLPEQLLSTAKFQTKVAPLTMPISEDIAKGRSIAAIDGCRKADRPDEVQVYLVHGDEQAEVCNVLLEGTNEMQLFGTLLEEPENDFGIHKGERLYFFMVKNEQGIMCLAPR